MYCEFPEFDIGVYSDVPEVPPCELVSPAGPLPPPPPLLSPSAAPTDRHYGVHTKYKQIRAHYVFSEEREEIKEDMLAMHTLDCGHGHMGEFFKCSSCDETKCPRCWMTCKDPGIKGLLTATASIKDSGEWHWRNTCKVCIEDRPYDRCPEDCPGRQKYRISDGVVECNDSVWSCSCRTCLDKRHDFDKDMPIKPTMCEAVRGREVGGLKMVTAQLPDQHMCRSCFASDFTRMEAMPLTIGGISYKVVFRASRHNWPDIKMMKANPPYHYLHSLEEGMKASAVEWSCLHVGRNHSCHWEGHCCEMLSTSIICSEAIRRLSPDRCLQVICIPEECWESGCVDFSSREGFARYSDLEKHLGHHKIKRADLEAWGCRYREVVLDCRAMRANMLMEWVLEIPAEDPFVLELKKILLDRDQTLHSDSGRWLHAERACRSLIAERAELTVTTQPWLNGTLPPPQHLWEWV